MPSYQQTIDAYSSARADSLARPKDATAAFNLAWWSVRVGKFNDAITAYERAISLGLSGPEEAMVNISSIYSERLGDATLALTWLERALAANAGFYPALFNRAHLAEQLGDREMAVDYFVRARRAKPADPLALTRLVEAMPVLRDDDPYVAQLRHFGAASADPDVFYALAKVEERLGNTDAAWHALQKANERDARGHPPWVDGQMRVRYQKLLTRSLPTPSQGSGANSPVFIVGMFRTGSTLLEQLLAAHSRFFPLGESEFWPRAIARAGGSMIGPAPAIAATEASALGKDFYAHLLERGVSSDYRVTDKRPDNIYHLPLIAAALPEARFIITERDWRDTLLSVWATRLHPQHGYATKLADIRAQLQTCRKLADIWCDQQPDRFYRFSYEALLANPEDYMRQLLFWLGEPWEAACLSFHQLQNPVRTASVWQVREPLTLTRQQRWRRYQTHLRNVFGNAIDEEVP